MRRFLVNIAPVAALLACGCGRPSHTGSGTPPSSGPTEACPQSAPCALSDGTAVPGYVATVGQVNYYTVSVSADHAGKRPIVQVDVDRTTPVSPVQLLFNLMTGDGKTVIGTRGPAATNGPTHLTANFLVPGPGTYLITVRDANNAASDAHNPYTVSASVINDPDTGEPDGTVAMARPLTLGMTVSGYIASAGDQDLISFTQPSEGLMHMVLHQAAADGPLQLDMRLLLLSPATPDDLSTATIVNEYTAVQPGGALDVDVIRLLSPGSYVVALSDASGQNADARPSAEWSFTATTAVSMDPQDQNGMSNDTVATATSVPSSGSSTYTGVIGYEGDRDWFHVAMPASDTAQIVEIRIDPMQSNQDIQLIWAVGTPIAHPTQACDSTCGPTAFCQSGLCGFDLHAYHGYIHGETAPQVVRLRVQGEAQDIYIYLADQGDNERTTNPYQLDVRVLPDPDPNEPTTANDSIATATPLAGASGADGGETYPGSGMISWWDYIDGLGTFQEREDVDWYALQVPRPATMACVPGASDGGSAPDASLPDGGTVVWTQTDAGEWCPTLPDGGTAYTTPGDGLVMRWHGPADGTYQIGFQGMASVGDAGPGCVFSFDQRIAHSDGDGGYSLGDQASDPCFCLPPDQAAQGTLWVRVDGPHRPVPPAPNAYSDQPYAFELSVEPGQLQSTCKGQCPALKKASKCP